jgi:hypothetical protein
VSAVPGRDPGHHPERPPQRHRERPRHVGPDYLADRQVAPVGGLAEQPGRGDDLKAGEPGRAAGLGREQVDDVGPAAFDDVGRAQEQRLLLGRRQLGPGREGGRGGSPGWSAGRATSSRTRASSPSRSRRPASGWPPIRSRSRPTTRSTC